MSEKRDPAPGPTPFPSFAAFAARDDRWLDVPLGAALVARDAYPELDVGRVLATLDNLARPLRDAGLASAPPARQTAEMANYLYEHAGFHGNESDYHDPRNSLLNDVLERRTGIPITLGIVYCHVAQWAGIPARGVSFPGHYLVRIERRDSPAPLVIDPYRRGNVLDGGALAQLLRRVGGPDATLKLEHLAPASPRTTLVRLLTNLKGIYLARGDRARAHLALDRIVSLVPHSLDALRERGLIAAQLGSIESARADLRRVVELSSSPHDAQQAQRQLDLLKGRTPSLN